MCLEILSHLYFFLKQVYLYGGQVTSWKNDHGEELLFVSSKAPFKPPKAIRGGIPICFPQFGSHGHLEQHGFARNRFWSIDHDPPPFLTNNSNKAFVDLILKHSEEDAKIWPHRYEFRLRVTLGPGGDLMLTSRIRNTNTDGKSFTFTFAYHNYFSVSDIRFNIYLSFLASMIFMLRFLAIVRPPEGSCLVNALGPDSFRKIRVHSDNFCGGCLYVAQILRDCICLI
ncbi:putative glucose-6-phosphate 1-epimerase [Actinidia eriantha]|uniref:putative glucose-6-phosphate 1-epimerase n=1 Tax=Actinidia eriantha TaxID=165200 RepID=UPI0025853B13|nr:putative glucose-6-phosphate 1-epimerase [Actinidia eriantha]